MWRAQVFPQDHVVLIFLSLIDNEQLDRMDTGVCALVPLPDRFNDESAGSVYVALAGLRVGHAERSQHIAVAKIDVLILEWDGSRRDFVNWDANRRIILREGDRLTARSNRSRQ